MCRFPKTKIALPESRQYIIKLGSASYIFAATNALLAKVLNLMGIKDIKQLKKVRNAAIAHDIDFILEQFEHYKNFQNNILHSAPCDYDGRQVLCRKITGDGRMLVVTEEYLDEFLILSGRIADALYKVQKHYNVFKEPYR
jgi:hypothetical protein